MALALPYRLARGWRPVRGYNGEPSRDRELADPGFRQPGLQRLVGILGDGASRSD
jgi:hypothetical protein